MNNTTLIIGDYVTSGADTCNWADQLLNPIDYDCVIIDMFNLRKQLLDLEPAPYGANAYILKKYSPIVSPINKNVAFIREKLSEILDHPRTIYALWSPAIEVFQYPKGHLSVKSDGWSPVWVQTSSEVFTQISVIDKSYVGYLSKIRQFEFYFLPLSLYLPKVWGLSLTGKKIAENRIEKPIALELDFESSVGSDSKQRARIVLLPTSHLVSSHTLIQAVIDKTGINKTPAPIWIDQISIPDELSLTQVQQTKVSELETIEAELDKIREAKSLLYSTGSELENACKSIFRQLGAMVKEAPPGIGDFVIETEHRNLLVEVKGNIKQVLKEDISQLVTDIGQYPRMSEKPIKGLLIGNAWRQLSLEQRKKHKAVFVKEVYDIAEKMDICLLSSESLFWIYVKVREKSLSRSAFLQQLIECKGQLNVQ